MKKNDFRKIIFFFKIWKKYFQIWKNIVRFEKIFSDLKKNKK